MFATTKGLTALLVLAFAVTGCAPSIQMAKVAPKRDTRDFSVCATEGVSGEGRASVRGDLRIVVNNRLSSGCVTLEVQRVGTSLTQRSALLVPGESRLVGFSSIDEWDGNRARVGAIAGAIIGALASKDNAKSRAQGVAIGAAAGAVLAQEVSTDPRVNIIVRVYDENGRRTYESDPYQQGIPTWQARSVTLWVLERSGTTQLQWQW
jgi:hypothetical protein